MSCKLKSHEKNYLIYYLELATIVHMLKILRCYIYVASSEVYTDNRHLQHLSERKDLNLRKKRWLELGKDYDITILYHLGKANVVVDSMSRKAKSMGSLAFIRAVERHLAMDVQALANCFVRLDIWCLAKFCLCCCAVVFI
ncbi:uncharacterized protein [Nicotiana tomentosiformis]|uniref:uncharacterized protein n=1 Tax=Nicotiana tomentosiformis TaxID=4098 RepID=UPI00388C7592